MFIFETQQLIEQLEKLTLQSEKASGMESSINEIFRIMHTIKGSSAMMECKSISSLAHIVEDLFNFIRENKPGNIDYKKMTDIVLGAVDFIKREMCGILDGSGYNSDASRYETTVREFLSELKHLNLPSGQEDFENNRQKTDSTYPDRVSKQDNKDKTTLKNIYDVELFFEENCQMENIRAFAVIHRLNEVAVSIDYWPEDIMENDQSAEVIRKSGFKIKFSSELPLDVIKSLLQETMFIKELNISIDKSDNILEIPTTEKLKKENNYINSYSVSNSSKDQFTNSIDTNVLIQTMISVSTKKLDILMDLVGELVISEAMVLQNPELKGLNIEGFRKDASQLQKITNELRDTVMSIRMVPLSVTFQKMNRIVRDMSNKLCKEVELEIIGEQTEVDKNIIDRITDPLMHIIRNAIDHGIESAEERSKKGKQQTGKITLEAKNAGGDVWITVKDDGKGLDKEKILKKAIERGMAEKGEFELTDKEIFSFIFLPSFSTKEEASEFSGRGVGLDVVRKNVEQLGGVIIADSTPGQSTSISLKIPLTLAIIDGMLVKVGKSTYTIPTINIVESFRANQKDILVDESGNEMIIVRGKCYRLVKCYKV